MELYVENEFSIELVLYICFAYGVHKRGDRIRVSTYEGMQPFYYFLGPECVTYRQEVRKWVTPSQRDKLLEARDEYEAELYLHPTWHPPPYKKFYANQQYIYPKPLLIVCNKFNGEWNRPPINFIPVQCLSELLETLIPKYQIVYIRPQYKTLSDGYSPDHTENMDLNEMVLIRTKFPSVIIFDDLIEESYNLTKLRLFANCDNFISVQGGNAHMCAFFAKKLLVLHIEGPELQAGVYDGWYRCFHGADVYVATDTDSLLCSASALFF